LVGFPRACGGRQPCAVMQSLALGPQVAFLEAADPAANRQGVSQIQASRGYQSSMRRVLQLSTAGGGHFEAAFISEIAAGRQRATTGHQVLTFRTRARLSFAPPPCRMPLGQSQCIPQADPGGMATPRFWHRLIRFRHVISGSLALASLNHTCRNLVPTFPQRSPPSLLTTAACGGLRSTPDCRPRRALLHLSYSYAPPCGPALLVTQCQ